MVRRILKGTILTLGVLSIAGGASAENPCADRGEAQCKMHWIQEYIGEDCYNCGWSSSNKCGRDPKYPIGCRTFKFSSTGPIVKELQMDLKKKSFDVDVTGKFDDRTRKAIETFQQQLNLKKDGLGIAGPETLGKLKQ